MRKSKKEKLAEKEQTEERGKHTAGGQDRKNTRRQASTRGEEQERRQRQGGAESGRTGEEGKGRDREQAEAARGRGASKAEGAAMPPFSLAFPLLHCVPASFAAPAPTLPCCCPSRERRPINVVAGKA